MIDFARHAMEYAKIGWPAFPVAAGDKVPAIKGGHGVKDATTDSAVIRRWARSFPDANIGLACGDASGGIVVVDVDPRHGGDSSIAALAMKGRCFPDGPQAKTGNGGQHLLFKYSGKLMNSKGKLGAGLDIRTTGGYIVAPPSWLKPSESGPGGFYQWVVRPPGLDGEVRQLPIPRLPVWVGELLKPQEPKPYVAPKTFQEGASRLNHLVNFASNAQKGQRNTSTFWAACRAAEMAADGKISRALVMERLIAAGLMAGLPRDEVEKTVASALSHFKGDKEKS